MKNTFISVWRWLWLRKWWVVVICFVLLLLLLAPTIYAYETTKSSRYTAAHIEQIPKHKVAIVLGAGVLPDGTPTPYLERRLDTAAKLYKAGKAEVLLLSGDNSASHYNEPEAMKRYIVTKGVKEQDIVLDYGGFNTYDSCYRAKAIFGLHEAVLVSHDYHLPRAILTCNHLGVTSIGLAAEGTGRAGRDYSINYLARELASTDKAFFQLLTKPNPTVMGKPEPIK